MLKASDVVSSNKIQKNVAVDVEAGWYYHPFLPTHTATKNFNDLSFSKPKPRNKKIVIKFPLYLFT